MGFQNLLEFLNSVDTTLRTSENSVYHNFGWFWGLADWIGCRSLVMVVFSVNWVWLVGCLVGLVGAVGW